MAWGFAVRNPYGLFRLGESCVFPPCNRFAWPWQARGQCRQGMSRGWRAIWSCDCGTSHQRSSVLGREPFRERPWCTGRGVCSEAALLGRCAAGSASQRESGAAGHSWSLQIPWHSSLGKGPSYFVSPVISLDARPFLSSLLLCSIQPLLGPLPEGAAWRCWVE